MDEPLDLAGALMRERVRARLLGATPRSLRIGRFELERPCGRGGEGQVFAARDTVAQARVALKCLNSVRAGEQAALQHEFRALSHLVHPNLVSMQELFCIDGAWFFTMELLEGQDVLSYLRAHPSALRDVLRQLLSGLAAIHDAGFVHRDVKPSNVLVEPSGRVVLVDFGLVARSQSRGASGTPAYMAPEQARGEPLTAAADMYAVGAILAALNVREFGSLLAEDPALRPTARELLEVGRAPRAPREARFVGRTVELARLQAAWSGLRDPRIVLVHGESGMGKSALVAELASRAPREAWMLRGRCYERETAPYKVFETLLQVRPLVGDQDRERAFAALRAHLLALGCPIVLIVDDLQWADLDSLALLQALFAPGTGLPMLLVGNYRRGEAQTNAFLSALLEPRELAPPLCPIEQLALEPLSVPDARALAAQWSEGIGDALLASAQGVPFLLIEAALAGATELREVDALIDLRLARVSPAAAALLEVLAVAGHPLPIALALHAASAPFAAALELVSMRGARFRDLAGERCLEPYHDRVRARVRATNVRALHLRIADSMEQLGLNAPLRRVEHLRAAGEDERAATLALQAGELACAQLAWSRAAELLAFAFALGHGERRRLADVSAFAGRHAEAGELYLAEAATTLAAQQFLRAGQTERGMALLWDGLPELPRATWRANLALFPSRVQTLLALRKLDRTEGRAHDERLRALETIYRELWLLYPVQSALAHDAFVREAMRGGPREKMMALTMEAVVRSVADGPAARTSKLLRGASAIASGTPYDAALLLIARGIVALHTEWRPREAIGLLERAELLLASCPGTQFEREWATFALDHALELAGRLRTLSENVRTRQQRSMRVVSVPLVMLIEDRADDALALLRAPRVRMPFLDHVALTRLVSVQLYRGDPEAAYAQLEAGCRELRWELAMQSRLIRESTRFERARCAAALYVHTRAPRWKREFERQLVRRGPPLARARTRMLEASVAWADGHPIKCRALLRAARRAFERGQCDHGVACAQLRESQLDGNVRGRAWFVSQGVKDPERWLQLSGYWG